MKEIRTPDGKVFESITAFCKYYEVSRQKVYACLRQGVAIEKLINLEVRDTQVYDHKGILHQSTRSMCKAYGVTHSTYCRRRDMGMTLEERLMTPLKKARIDISALTGGRYETVREFAIENRLNYVRCCGLLSSGGTIEDCMKLRLKPPVVDHMGYHYDSITSMCADYNIPVSTYNSRKALGYSLEDRLTKPLRKKA